jgi:hypothetical protein
MQSAVAPMKPEILYFPEGRREAFPCALTGEHGAGHVVYFAGGVHAAYFSYGYPYQRLLLAQAARWAARETCPVSVQAPMCVQSTFWKQSTEAGPRASPSFPASTTKPGSSPCRWSWSSARRETRMVPGSGALRAPWQGMAWIKGMPVLSWRPQRVTPRGR